MMSTPKEATPAVRVVGLSKVFPGVVALDDFSLDLAPSSIHGLVGENGAGKSTFIKLLTGAESPDAGSIEVFGEPMPIGDPRAGFKLGISATYQELNIVPEMTAAQNVFLGRSKRRGPFVRRTETEACFRTRAQQLSIAIDPNAKASTLSVANQQLLAIMRSLEAEHRIIILDEPTASLGPKERQKLYELMRGLKEEGLTVLFVSHDLDEVLRLCDVVTVMRDGRLAATRSVHEWTKAELVCTMLAQDGQARDLAGAMLGQTPTTAANKEARSRREVLRVEDLSLPGVLESVSFSLREGEILGIAGLVGAGRTELLRALAGAERVGRGRLFIDGKERPWPKSVHQALGLGIALSPEERKTQGLVLSLTGAKNVALSDLRAVAKGPFIDGALRERSVKSITDRLAFDSHRLNGPAGVLSGGNQQKLVIAKWLHRKPRVLLLDEPTRGVDVGARDQIFSLIRELAQDGLSLILVSSELEEVVGLADRVIVLAGGRQVCAFDRPDATVEGILRVVFDVEGAA